MSFSLFSYYIHICLKQNKSNNEKILLKVPLLNFEGGPGVLLSNFEGGPRVPLLNFRGVLGPTLKLWGGSPVPGPRVPRSRPPGPWSDFTMPIKPCTLLLYCQYPFDLLYKYCRYDVRYNATLEVRKPWTARSLKS